LIKLAKYLKPFIFGVLLSFVLLYGQAMSNLYLPNFMSDIVNVGIQQNGIEHAAPDAISINGLTLMTSFMTDDEKQLAEDSYMLVNNTDENEDGQEYDSIYPNGENRFYIKTDIDEEASAELDDAFGAATATFMIVMKDMAEQSGQANMQISTSIDSSDIDLEELYSALPMMTQLPQPVIDEAHEQAVTQYESIQNQMGLMLAKVFYEELGVDMHAVQKAYIIRVGAIMLIIALLGGVATVLVSLISSRIAAGVARNLRKSTFEKIESFSSTEFNKFSTASLITRCTNDITQIQLLLMVGIRMICYAPIMAVGGIIMAVDKSPSMSWILAVACIAIAGLILVVLSIAMPKFKIMQKLVDRLNLVARENLSGMMVIRAFATQKHEKKRFEAANGELTRTNLFVTRVMAFMMSGITLIMNGITLVIVWVGANQIANSGLQIGDMMAFMQYAMQIIMSFMMISMMFIFVPRAAVSANRIAEVLEVENKILDPKVPKGFDETRKGLVEFKDVYFKYEGASEYALKDINFTAYPGQTTAIIGSTGSGKSTIANLLLRFYDVTKGSVIVDGADVRDVTLKDLREKIGYVPQKGVLISGTIASNLRYGKKDAGDEEIKTAAKVAQAIDFIEEKEDGFDSAIAQGGGNVSGGQKQRLSIARALVRDPEIFIFDDSFSALDYKTDVALRKALHEHTGDSTVIVVGQRVSTIMHAQQIIVLDKGKIVGMGTHKDLLKTCPEYLEIATSQLSGEELA
jgi:ATP-binding cassette subfamily B protein